ncbi:MAG: hypothetical protein Q8O76_05090, partial [Chloroflexota bacterium]|nr:hypothetical protein [Chloroflexota bacterium]
DASCCGVGSWGYVQVPGYLVRKHIRNGEGVSPVSEVETIQDEDDRNLIMEFLRKKYPTAQIEMW